MKQKLKVGLLINSENLTDWAYKMISKINDSDYAEISLIIKNSQRKKKSIKNRLINNYNKVLYKLYRKFDNHFFSTNHNPFERKKIDFLDNVDLINVNPIRTKFRDTIADSDINKIDNYELDVIIRLGFRILSGKILKLPKFGIWSYHHGNNNLNRGGPPGFWEVIRGENETGITLQILSEKLDGGIVIMRSFSKTNKKIVKKNLANYYPNSISHLPNKLNELFNDGEEKFFKKIDKINTHPFFYSRPLFVVPTNKELLYPLFRLSIRYIIEKLKKLVYRDQWIILYNFNIKNEFVNTSLYNYKKILPPNDRFWADPFVVQYENKYYVFIEEYIYKKRKGTIAFFEINKNGSYTKPNVILEKEYHLSYPFIFEENDKIYMIP